MNYVECPFMVEYCNNMIALERCLAFGSLSSKHKKTYQNRKSQKKSMIKK